jgi:hypothetical protein
MTYAEAQAAVRATNPDAVFEVTSTFRGEPDSFDAYDFTYSDEVRARVFTFDACTGDLETTFA